MKEKLCLKIEWVPHTRENMVDEPVLIFIEVNLTIHYAAKCLKPTMNLWKPTRPLDYSRSRTGFV